MLSGSNISRAQRIGQSRDSGHRDHRLQLLLDWLQRVVCGPVLSLEYASGDASFRRYFRLRDGERTLIVMDAPPEIEKLEPFIKVSRLFAAADICVPEIVEFDERQGFMLLEDLGSVCYLSRLDENSAPALYRDAMDVVVRLQRQIELDQCDLPLYDRDLVQRELGLFADWFLSAKLGIRLSDPDMDLLMKANNFLTDALLEQPKVVVHRDFHSRNLMVIEDRNPGVLDFQDAVIGPLTYDLVSLLRDCYIAWPESLVDRWVAEYYDRLDLPEVDYNQFYRWFELTGLQRHLKAVGIFSRLDIRDGKAGYLTDIPRTLSYVHCVAKKYPELAALSTFLNTTVTERMNRVS